MAIREATEADLPALAPLLRGYADFYESDPPDEGLEAMARDVIAAPEEQAFLLVATDDADQVVGFALNQWKWSSLRGERTVVMDDGRTPVRGELRSRERCSRGAGPTPTCASRAAPVTPRSSRAHGSMPGAIA